MIPVPEEIEARAWDAAYVLTRDFPDRITLEQRIRCEVALRSDRLGWVECGDMLRLYSFAVEERV